MPKTIDYPRTSYLGAWEVAEIVDDTGGKCAIETAARKLNRKVSGSFKAIIGSAVKFGLLTSKREFLTTTNLFRRIKHAYDKQEEKIYHREAFLHPPLFTQICRKFRNRELPVHMFDVMLIREFGVEEINAQSVSKAFLDGARMAGILDERNVIADIDQLSAQQAPRRELASGEMPLNVFRQNTAASAATQRPPQPETPPAPGNGPTPVSASISTAAVVPPSKTADAVSSLFGLDTDDLEDLTPDSQPNEPMRGAGPEAVFMPPAQSISPSSTLVPSAATPPATPPIEGISSGDQPAGSFPTNTDASSAYTIRISGPGLDTQLFVQDVDDLDIVTVLLNKIRRQLAK